MLEKYDTFISVIESVQTYINYDMFPSSQKEYCRGNFFETNGNQAMALMYFVSDTTDMSPGYYVGLWIEHTDGTISCLTNKLIEEAHNPDDAYVTVTIRQIADKEYLNPYIRTTKNSTDISKNQYYSIGDELVSEYYLYSESPFIAMEDGLIQHDESNSVFYLNQKPIDRSTYYATQDKLNIGTFLLEINANWSEGLPPQGYTFEELLDQLNGNNSSEYNDEFTTLTATLGYSSDSAKAILNTFIPFCRTLSNTYISSKGDTAKQRSCLVVEFEPGIPNLVVHYWDPNGDSPGEFCETWIIYGIENGKITELFCDENYSPTRRDIAMVYDESYRFALREEQTGGYYELIIHYPDNTTEKGLYENYKYIYLPEDEHFLRVWTLSGSYLDIPF